MNNKEHLRQTSLEILSIVEDLPTLPDRFLQIQEVIHENDSTLQDLTDIIQTDQATSAILLKVANSSYYNPLGSPVSRLSYAISRLGRQETGDIALSMSLLYGFAIPASIHVIRGFWAHAFAVAQISRFIATHHPSAKQAHPDELFMAALLHDIGRVILGMRIDMSYFEKDFSGYEENELIAAEEKYYGINHAEVGGVVLKQWGLPPEIYRVVANHHQATPESLDTMICMFADDFVSKHLKFEYNIEDVQMKLRDGLLEQAVEDFTVAYA